MSDKKNPLLGHVVDNFDARAYQHLFKSLKKNSPHEIIALTRKIINEFGITGFFVFELRWPASFLFGAGTLPESFISGVQENGFQNADQVIRHLMTDPRTLPQPLFRSTVDSYVGASPYSSKAIERHKEFAAYLKQFCIREIYYHPFRPAGFDCGAVIALYGSGEPQNFRESVARFSARIEPLAQAFCEALGRHRFHRRRLDFVKPAPVEVIRLMVEKDLSGGEIAALKEVHEVTIYKQIAELKKALRVSSFAGIVAQCLKLGLVTLDDIY